MHTALILLPFLKTTATTPWKRLLIHSRTTVHDTRKMCAFHVYKVTSPSGGFCRGHRAISEWIQKEGHAPPNFYEGHRFVCAPDIQEI